MISMNLKNLRNHHKLTQEELAFQLNVSRQLVAKWENGDSTPDLKHSKALADFYNVTLDALVEDNEKFPEGVVPAKGKHFFGTAKIGERGQIVIPKKARDLFNIKPGDSLIFLGDEERGLAIVPEEMLHAFFNMVTNSKKLEEQ